MRRKYLQVAREYYLGYEKNSQNSIKAKNMILTWGKDMSSYFTEEDIQIISKHMFNIFTNW